MESKRHKQRGGKLIIRKFFDTKNNRISFSKYRTRLQKIGNRTILHYDQVR